MIRQYYWLCEKGILKFATDFLFGVRNLTIPGSGTCIYVWATQQLQVWASASASSLMPIFACKRGRRHMQTRSWCLGLVSLDKSGCRGVCTCPWLRRGNRWDRWLSAGCILRAVALVSWAWKCLKRRKQDFTPKLFERKRNRKAILLKQNMKN